MAMKQRFCTRENGFQFPKTVPFSRAEIRASLVRVVLLGLFLTLFTLSFTANATFPVFSFERGLNALLFARSIFQVSSMPVGCAKSILISFNLILWLAGGTVLVLGTWIFVDPSKIHLFHFITSDDLNTDFGYYLAYILLSLGGFIFMSGLCGCCGAVRENRCLLVAYFGLLFLLMCVEVTMAVLTFMYRDYFLAGLEGRLSNGLVQRYGYKNSNEKYLSFSEAVDFAQYKFKCCGIKGDIDYQLSNWRNESNADMERRNVPLTCCVIHEPGEVEEPWQNPNVKDDISCQDPSEKVHIKARHKQGCINDIETWFKKETTILITVGISSAALQVIGMIFSICFCRSLSGDI